ncbi:hypothetical protein Rsub_01475 [Raphidocelis subcapitata]|uniref:Uncharacterized protein n=1 Tax=Raphidocelis subcapitata TaxID=307507 RepID=A0A2V0NN62_9CHLO|nr:hypothetical protein Rsub_01475 [Raphidocelis subcapitata]|eukprot:GBF88976.1 hypothetical protein Rsub_01475 [Raphidocelis subcapitata]
MPLPRGRAALLVVVTWAALTALSAGVHAARAPTRRTSTPSVPGAPSLRRAVVGKEQPAVPNDASSFQVPPRAVGSKTMAKVVSPGVPNLQLNMVQQSGPILTKKDKAAGFSWLGTNSIGVAGLPGWTPPDPALCAGNGYVVEVVNSFISIYNTNGTRLLFNELDAFLGGDALWGSIVDTSQEYALAAIDPNCAWDPTTRRWFFSCFLGFNDPPYLVVSASKGEDPAGAWSHWVIDPNTPTTPPPEGLFPDYPQFQVYPGYMLLTTNEFSFTEDAFFGTNLYVFPTTGGLLSDADSFDFSVFPRLGVFDNGTAASAGDWNLDGVQGYASYHVWPAALAVSGPSEAAGDPGVIYLAEQSSTSPALNVWTLKGAPAAVAGGGAAALSLDVVVLPFKKGYVTPPLEATQKAGACRGLKLDSNGPYATGAALANGGRDLHVVATAGVQRKSGPTDVGVAWFRVAVGLGGGTKPPKLKKQRILSAPEDGDNLIFPGIGLDPAGKFGLVVYSVTGTNYYPSPGFTVIRGGKPKKGVNVVATGVAQACNQYKRWGDYQTVRLDEEGNFYGTAEWIASQESEALSFYWATRIMKFTPEDLKQWN